MRESRDENHAPNDVGKERRQKKLAEIDGNTDTVRNHHVKDRGGSCDDVIETSQADDVGRTLDFSFVTPGTVVLPGGNASNR
jgi:hypothetical protein